MRVAVSLCIAGALVAGVAAADDDPKEKAPDYASKPLGAWIKALKDDTDQQLPYHIRKALGPGGPYAKVAVPALIESFKGWGPFEEPFGIPTASLTLADYGPPVVPALVRALESPEMPVRVGVVQALSLMDPKSPQAVSALIGAMKDPAWQVRMTATYGLQSTARREEKAFSAIVSSLRDREDHVREAAASALNELGRKAKPAMPELILALKDEDGRVRGSAAQALWQIGPDAKAAVPGLIEVLRDTPKDFGRWQAAQALGGIGPAAKDAVPALIEALRNKDELVYGSAVQALGEIGPAARAAVPVLLNIAKDKSIPNPDSAILALGKIGPDARAAVPFMMEMLATGKFIAYRQAAAKALGGIGAEARSAVPTLAAIVRNRSVDSQIRQAAAESLSQIDPAFAARQGMDTAWLDVRLGKIPSTKLEPRTPTEERKQQIKKLIAELAQVSDPDFGMSPTLSGRAFAPLPGSEHSGAMVLTDHRLKTAAAFRSLVEMGPEALPFLLDALEDATPTKLKVDPLPLTGFGTELTGNPLNPTERRLLSETELRRTDDDGDQDVDEPYTLKVGDVCFVIIGQIVSRPYSAAHYQPSSILIINSPVKRKALRDRARAVWRSADPARKLLDSLLIDYATEGIIDGGKSYGWNEGSERQIEAVMRLLYYFPRETGPLVAERLRSLDVQAVDKSKRLDREVKNRVNTVEFITAVAWCTEPPVKAALADIAKRTNDPEIKAAVERRRNTTP